jgi:hypothetical protein
MEASTNLTNHTAEQKITDRITALRMRWLRHVETQLASQQGRPALDHYDLSAEPAE